MMNPVQTGADFAKALEVIANAFDGAKMKTTVIIEMDVEDAAKAALTLRAAANALKSITQ